MQGKSLEASHAYQAAIAASSPAPQLVYRLGLCAERLGKIEKAQDYYETLVRPEPTVMSFAGTLGQARLYYLERKLDSCLEKLSEMSLVSGLDIYTETQIGSDVDFFAALTQSELATSGLTHNPLDAGHVFTANVEFRPEHLLRLAQIEVTLPDMSVNGMTPAITVHGKVGGPSTTLVSTNFSNQPLALIVETLGQEIGWEVRLSTVAREILLVKRDDVIITDRTASELLSLLLERHGLSWSFNENVISITQQTALETPEMNSRRRIRSIELLQRALAETPDHSMAPFAYLALGNLAAINGRNQSAEAYFGQLVERFPRHSASQIATFNLAKVKYANGRTLQAMESFYEVVNLRYGTRLDTLSYLFLGKLHLELANAKAAKTELSRCISMADTSEITATATLTLAAAYLLKDDASSAMSANAVLMENRDALKLKPHKAPAAFLSSLTLFRTTSGETERQRRGQELLAATLQVEPSDFFGTFGYLLMGQAFTDVGLVEETIRLYREGLNTSVSETTRNELLFRLAGEYEKQGQMSLARDCLQELTTTAAWASKAAISLAELLKGTGPRMSASTTAVGVCDRTTQKRQT